MAEFKTKLLTLAGIATMFAGMAHAQINGAACTQAAGAIFVAAEGTTEQVADLTLTCGVSAAAATVNLTVYLSPAVTITSAVVNNKSETLAGFGVPGGALTGAVNGTVSGSSVSFNGIAVTAGATVTLTITNIKINASQVATSSGAPTAITETVFISGTNVTPAVLGAQNVAFSTNGLTGVKATKLGDTTKGADSVSICTGKTAFDTALYQVVFGEGFAGAFKIKGDNVSNATLGSEFVPGNNSYTGYGFASGSGTNTATSGTRVSITFNNIPGNVRLFVPLTIANNGGVMKLTTSATGAFNAATGSTANGAPGASDNGHAGDGSAGELTVSNGSATAIYEETTSAGGAVETYTVPVFVRADAAAVAAPSTAITSTVSFAPIGSASSTPNFVSGSSTATSNGSAFNACNTTLLFPFVTNQLGFDTGIAIANTSTDLLNGGTKSNAAAQSGTCSLTFFGNTAPAAAVTTPTVTTGTVYAAAASTVAPGFQGYMIANCNFLYGHGFSYVVYNLTQNNGAAMGYLAAVINSDRKQTGTDGDIGNKNPESAGN